MVVARGIVDLLVDVWFVVAGCLVLLLVWGVWNGVGGCGLGVSDERTVGS